MNFNKSLNLRNKSCTVSGHITVAKEVQSSTFSAHMAGRAWNTMPGNISQCSKTDIIRIIITGEEKPVMSFNTMRLKADKELLIIPNVGMSKRNAHLTFPEVGFFCFESREKTQHGSITLFQDW